MYVGYGFKTSVIFVGEGWQGALDNKGAAKHDSSLFNIGEGWQGAAEYDRGAADMIQVCLI